MPAGTSTPKTLKAAVEFFSDPQNCHDYAVSRRWPTGVVCPRCGSTSVTYLPGVCRFQCSKRHASRQFTIKTGTIFEDSPLGLDKWLMAMWLIVNAKNGISSWELHRALGVTQKTAWFMLHRIRLAMQRGSFDKLTGEVEADETRIGGIVKNMHKAKRVEAATSTGRGNTRLTIVAGALERGGDVRLKIVPRADLPSIHDFIHGNVASGADLYTDEHNSYDAMNRWYIHWVINHSIEYVMVAFHTNGIENFWSLLKRTIRGTYVSVEPWHLHRYLDEQAFRFNERKNNDGGRFNTAMMQVSGKRLMYKTLIGKGSEESAVA